MGTVSSGGLHEQVPRHVPDSDWPELVWPKCPSQYGHANEMVDKFRLHCTGTKLIDSLVHGAPNDHERNSPQLLADLSATGTTDPTQHRLSLPKLEIIAVDADETPLEKWEAEDDVKGGPLDPREVKATRQKEI